MNVRLHELRLHEQGFAGESQYPSEKSFGTCLGRIAMNSKGKRRSARQSASPHCQSALDSGQVTAVWTIPKGIRSKFNGHQIPTQLFGPILVKPVIDESIIS